MLVLVSDRQIEQAAPFLADLDAAGDFLETHNAMETIGITLACLETGCEYIEYNRSADEKRALFPAKRFVERPNLEWAKLHLQSGDCLWNSGMFIWWLSIVTEHFKRLLPKDILVS